MTIYVKKDNQPFFPYTPELMSWEDWNGNFLIAYGQMNIPVNTEENWMETARVIASNTSFAAFPIPNPETYSDWKAWAWDVTQVINGPTH